MGKHLPSGTFLLGLLSGRLTFQIKPAGWGGGAYISQHIHFFPIFILGLKGESKQNSCKLA